MTWSNLLSGLIGAVLGGLLTLAASIMTMKQQRSLALEAAAEDRRQAQLRASYSASARILEDMLTLKDGLNALLPLMIRANTSAAADYDTAFNALDRIFVVHNALIADEALRSRINALTILVSEQWMSQENRRADEPTQAKRRDLIISYMEHVNQSIRAHLDNKPLPLTESVPNLLAVKNIESDPADPANSSS